MAYGNKNNCATDSRTIRTLGSGETLGKPTPNDNMQWNLESNEIQVKSIIAGSGCTVSSTDTELKITFDLDLYTLLTNTGITSACGESIDFEKLYGCSATGLYLLNNRENSAGIFIQDSSGNVGIGTITPTAKLQVSGSSILGASAGHTITFNASSAAVPNGLTFGANTFVIDETNGRVGVGVSSPTVELDVKGKILLGSASNLLIEDGKIGTISSGGLTLSAAANIVLDAGGGSVVLKDNASTFLNIQNSAAANVSLDAPGSITLDTSSGNIIIKEASVKALDIRTSAATKVTFKAPGDIVFAASGGNVLINDNSTSQATIFDFDADSSKLTIYDDAVNSDKFQISVNASGQTTLGTTHTAGTDGDIVLDADGDIWLDALSGSNAHVIFKKDGSTIVDVVLSNSATVFDAVSDIILDAAGANVKFKSNSAAIFDFDIANNTMKIMHSADTGDMFKVQVVSAGATTISTIDDDGTAGNLTLDVDGDVIIDADGGNVTFKDDGTTIFDVIYNGATSFTIDAPGDMILDLGGGDATLKKNGTTFGALVESSNELVIKSGTTPTTAITMTGANVAIAGNLTVNGTTTTINSTTTTVDDPIMTLGGDTSAASDDNKDRGIEFKYHNGTGPQVGFFGYDDSLNVFTAFTSATNSSEVFAGTLGDARFDQVILNTIASMSAAADITIDAGADIILDADGANIIFKDNSVTTLDITNSGAAAVVFDAPGNIVFDTPQNSGAIILKTANSAAILSISNSGPASVVFDAPGSIVFDADGAIVRIKDAGITTLDIGNSGASTVVFDAPGNIVLDADGGEIILKDGGSKKATLELTNSLRIATASGNLTLDAVGDIILDADGANIILKDASVATLDITNSGASAVIFDAPGNIVFDTPQNSGAVILKTLGSAAILSISNSGPAAVIFDAPGNIVLDTPQNSGAVILKTLGSAAILSISNSGPASVVFDAPGNIVFDTSQNSGAVILKTLGSAAILSISNSGPAAVIFDAPGNIVLDADGGIIRVKDNGATTLDIGNSGASTVVFDAPGNIVLDADGGIVRVKDNAVTTLDIANSGASTVIFDAPGSIVLDVATNTGTVSFKHNGSAANIMLDPANSKIHLKNTTSAGGYILFGNSGGSPGFRLGSAGGLQFKNSGGAWANVVPASAAIIGATNGADNRLATFTSAAGLNGEANLTFDGTDATIAGVGKLQFRDTASYIHSNDTNDLTVVAVDFTLDAGGDIILDADGGSVLIKDGNAGTILDIANSGASTVVFDATGQIIFDAGEAGILFKEAGSAAGMFFDIAKRKIHISPTASAGGYLMFGTSGGAPGFRLSSVGAIQLKNSGGAWSNIVPASAAIIGATNGADNRIATFTSAAGLNGEATLTFDGTDLLVTGVGKLAVGDSGTYINQSSDASLEIVSDGLVRIDAGTEIVLDSDSGNVRILDAGVEALNIRNSGAAAVIFDAPGNIVLDTSQNSGAVILKTLGSAAILSISNSGPAAVIFDAPGNIVFDTPQNSGAVILKTLGSAAILSISNSGPASVVFDVTTKLIIDTTEGVRFKDNGSATNMLIEPKTKKLYLGNTASAGGYLLFGNSGGSPGLRKGSAGHIQFRTTHGGVWTNVYNSSGGVAQANASNNRVVTSVDADNINAEANLTFDGTDAKIAGVGKLQFRDTTSYIHSNDTNDLTVVATDLTLNLGNNLAVNVDGGVFSVLDDAQLMLDVTHSAGASTTLLAGATRMFLATSAVGNRTIVDSHGGLITPALSIGRDMLQSMYGVSLSGSGGNQSGSYEIVSYNGANSQGSFIEFKRTRSTTLGAPLTSAGTIVLADDVLGGIRFKGSDGTSAADSAFVTFAEILAKADGGTSAGAAPGKLEFKLTPAAAKVPAVAMALMEDGVLKLPTPGTGGLRIATATAGSVDIQTSQTISANGRSFKLTITTHAAIDDGTRSVEITVQNDKVLGSDDLIIMNMVSANAAGIIPLVYNVTTGAFKLKILNHSGSQLSGDSVLVFRGMVINDGT